MWDRSFLFKLASKQAIYPSRQALYLLFSLHENSYKAENIAGVLSKGI